MIILAAVVNLCADMTARSAVSVETEADELERAIRNWQPTQLANVAALDATAVVSRTIAGQLWRLCALILLYQVKPLQPHKPFRLIPVCPSCWGPPSRSSPRASRDTLPSRLYRPSPQRRPLGLYRSPVVPRCQLVHLRDRQTKVNAAYDAAWTGKDVAGQYRID